MSDILERLENYIPGENDDCVAERIAEAVAEIKRLRGDHWQPIETAPQGEPVLLGFVGAFHPLVGHNEDGVWGELTPDMGFFVYPTQPTHWRPLPAPPLSPKEQP